MQSKIFHNTKYLEENLTTNNMPSSTYLNRKKIVDVNKLLNRVKINRQNEKKKKNNFFFFRNNTFKLSRNLSCNCKIDNFFLKS